MLLLTPTQNRLIERLPRRARTRLLAKCEPVQLTRSQVLCEPGTPARYVYFPTDSIISLVSRVDAHPGLEVGMVGCEGMLGSQLVLGISTMPIRALVQGTGTSWRVSIAEFKAELATSAILKRQLDRYLYVLTAQMMAASGCLSFHLIGPRLARRLLMSQDRAHNNRFCITHDFLAHMLGVRRVSVTVAASHLKRLGLVTYHRGELTVLDRIGLEAAACSCYAADRAVYAEHLG